MPNEEGRTVAHFFGDLSSKVEIKLLLRAVFRAKVVVLRSFLEFAKLRTVP